MLPEFVINQRLMMSPDLPLPPGPPVHRVRRSVPRDRSRDLWMIAVLLVLFVLGLGGLIAATGWSETWAQVARLGPAQFAALLALSLVNYLLRGLRWHLFARRLGLETTLWQGFRHFLGGFAMSVTPGRVGELVRMRWIARETGWSFARSAPLVLADRASDLAAMALLLGFGVWFAAGAVPGALPIAGLALAAAILVTRPRLLAALAVWGYRWTGRLPRAFARARSAALSLERFAHGPLLVAALALGVVGWMAEAIAFHLLLGWMGADIGLWVAAVIFLSATLAGGLTGAPGGLGGAEAAMIALLALRGVPPDAAVAATAIIRVTTLWFALAIGLVVFPVAERLSLRTSHALEDR